MPGCLERLPEALIQHVLTFGANNTKTLLRCELTSKRLKKVVGIDDTWKFLPGVDRWKDDDRIETKRKAACIHATLKAIRKEQKSGENILLAEFGADRWKEIPTVFCNRQAPLYLPLPSQSVDLRGDFLFCLVEVVQNIMITFIKRANLFATESSLDTDEYPLMTARHLHAQEALFDPDLINSVSSCIHGEEVLGMLPFLEETLPWMKDEGLKGRILGRIFHRAGVVMMDTEAWNHAWQTVIAVTCHLAWKPCLDLLVQYPESYGYGLPKRLLAAGESTRTTPPLSGQKFDEERNVFHVTHTPVPKQVEDAAVELIGSLHGNKVMGDFWIIPGVLNNYSKEHFDAMAQANANAEDFYDYEDDTIAEVVAENNFRGGEIDKFEELKAEMDMSSEDESDEWSAAETSSAEGDDESDDGWIVAYDDSEDDDEDVHDADDDDTDMVGE